MRIADAMKEIRLNNEDKGWESRGRDLFCEKMLLVVSEISEALEEFRNGRGLNEIYYPASGAAHREAGTIEKPEGIPIEIADAVIRLFDWCAANDVDLETALALKMAYNATRPHRHGGKLV